MGILGIAIKFRLSRPVLSTILETRSPVGHCERAASLDPCSAEAHANLARPNASPRIGIACYRCTGWIFSTNRWLPISRARAGGSSNFLGLAWEPACLDFHRTIRTVQTASSWQVRLRLYHRSVGQWRHYERDLGPLLQELGFNQ